MKQFLEMSDYDLYEMYLRHERLVHSWEIPFITFLLFFGGVAIGYLAGMR